MKTSFFPVLQAGTPSLESDLQQLVSLVRERESSLLMLFEQKKQKTWQRPEWLLKQCQYQQKQNHLSRQIRSLILRWLLLSNQEIRPEQEVKYIRSFWIKIKMVMKMSLEKIKILNYLNYPLFQRYETIIDAMNVGYDRAASISHYRDIEEMIKNRNRLIHQLLNQKPTSLERNHSQYRAKDNIMISPSDHKIGKLDRFGKKRRHFIALDSKAERRPLSQHSRPKMCFNSKQFLQSRKIKKIQNIIQRYEDKLSGAMAAKIDVNIDRKKNMEQNMETLYEQMLDKNINNHKIISKYIFSHSRNILRKLPSRKHLKMVSRPSTNIDVYKLPKRDTKKSRAIVTKPQIDTTERPSALPSRRAVSAKIKRKQLNKIRQSQLIQTGYKIGKLKKCL